MMNYDFFLQKWHQVVYCCSNVFNCLIDILTDLTIQYSPDPGDHWRRRSCCWRRACRTAWSRWRQGWISWFSSWTSSAPPWSRGSSCWGPHWCECCCSYSVCLSSAPPRDLWSSQTSPGLVWSQRSRGLKIQVGINKNWSGHLSVVDKTDFTQTQEDF